MNGLSEIILAYEDAAALPELIRATDAALANLTQRYELIVVDDGSTDGTAEIVTAMGEALPRLRFIRHEMNCGVGSGFRTGFMASRFDVIGYTDGDAQYSPGDIAAMVKMLEEADAVSGIRIKRAEGFPRTVVSRIYNFVLRAVYGLTLHDTNSGLKLYRRRFLEAAMPLRSDGPFFDAEILIKGMHAGMKVAETPIEHRPRRHGRGRGASLSSIARALRELSAEEMKVYVRRNVVARWIHRVISLLASSMPRSRWPRAATNSPTSVSRADICR